MRNLLLATVLLLAGANGLFAQNEQIRVVVHPTVALGEHWQITGWVVVNEKENDPENANLFYGLEYRNKKKGRWLEIQAWRQWSRVGNQKFLDVRFFQKFGESVSMFVEVSPSLTKEGTVYNYVSLEHRIVGRLRGGVEAENFYRPGRDSLGGGPRVSYTIMDKEKLRVDLALSHQVRPGERDARRLWIVVTPRL